MCAFVHVVCDWVMCRKGGEKAGARVSHQMYKREIPIGTHPSTEQAHVTAETDIQRSGNLSLHLSVASVLQVLSFVRGKCRRMSMAFGLNNAAQRFHQVLHIY